jgi:hypothetical protein
LAEAAPAPGPAAAIVPMWLRSCPRAAALDATSGGIHSTISSTDLQPCRGSRQPHHRLLPGTELGCGRGPSALPLSLLGRGSWPSRGSYHAVAHVHDRRSRARQAVMRCSRGRHAPHISPHGFDVGCLGCLDTGLVCVLLGHPEQRGVRAMLFGAQVPGSCHCRQPLQREAIAGTPCSCAPENMKLSGPPRGSSVEHRVVRCRVQGQQGVGGPPRPVRGVG